MRVGLISDTHNLLRPVRGNNDKGAWAAALRETQRVKLGTLYVIHDLSALDIDPVSAGVRVVVSGHSHRRS